MGYRAGVLNNELDSWLQKEFLGSPGSWFFFQMPLSYKVFAISLNEITVFIVTWVKILELSLIFLFCSYVTSTYMEKILLAISPKASRISLYFNTFQCHHPDLSCHHLATELTCIWISDLMSTVFTAQQLRD
jgi:hypothetical protein